jgi:hypothetical protein
MSDASQIFAAHRPRVGQEVTYEGKVAGKVTSVEGSLCYCSYSSGTAPFIWCFAEGLNTLHDWPTKTKPRNTTGAQP